MADNYNHYVYVMKSSDGYIKVGRTTNVNSRAKQIGRQLYCTMTVQKVYGFNAKADCATAEKYLHALMLPHASDKHESKEWFMADAESLAPKDIDLEAATWFLIRNVKGFASKRLRNRFNPQTKRWEPFVAKPYL